MGVSSRIGVILEQECPTVTRIPRSVSLMFLFRMVEGEQHRIGAFDLRRGHACGLHEAWLRVHE